MEELMSEVADLVLFSDRSRSFKGSGQELRREDESDPAKASSMNLLRSSIARSIRNRCTEEIEVTESNTAKKKRGKRYKEPLSNSRTIDVQMLNTKLPSRSAEKTISLVQDDQVNVLIDDEIKPDITRNAFTRLLSETESFDSQKTCNDETCEIEMEEKNKDNFLLLDKEVRKRVAENGIKLARRKFSDGIFENCSTYSLACPEVLLETKNFLSSVEDSTAGNNHSLADKPEVNRTNLSEEKESDCSPKDSCTEDQISLGDSFFANVMSEEYVSNNAANFRNEKTGSRNNSVPESSANDNDSVDIAYDKHTGVHIYRNCEHKLSKRNRKRQRKNRSKDAPVYECPKCRVSYLLSSNTSGSIARCLHCDFWTSVEPVFLKREKTQWNTCRIC